MHLTLEEDTNDTNTEWSALMVAIVLSHMPPELSQRLVVKGGEQIYVTSVPPSSAMAGA